MVDHDYWRLTRTQIRRPGWYRLVECDGSRWAVGTGARGDWNDLGHQDRHIRVVISHLANQGGERRKDLLRRTVAPDIVGPKMHDHNVGIGLAQPARQGPSIRQVGGQLTPVALIVTIVGDAASLRG